MCVVVLVLGKFFGAYFFVVELGYLRLGPCKQLVGHQLVVHLVDVFAVAHHTVYIAVEPCCAFIQRSYAHVAHHLALRKFAELFGVYLQLVVYNELIADEGPLQ